MMAMFNDLKDQLEQQTNITTQLQGEINKQTDLDNRLHGQLIQLQGDIHSATILKGQLEKYAGDSQKAFHDQIVVIEALKDDLAERVSCDGCILPKGTANHLTH
jgi:hypothetical protein